MDFQEAKKLADESDAISIVSKWIRDERTRGSRTPDIPITWHVPSDEVRTIDGEFYSPY